MSFQLGSFNAASVSGLKAILQEWPMLPPEVHLDSLAAGDGALFYRARLTQKEWCSGWSSQVQTLTMS